MERYVALLRGVNVSGKNKVAMPALKEGFAELGFADVATCLNSGNVVFSSDAGDRGLLVGRIESMLGDAFGLDVPVFVASQEELAELLSAAPAWWGSDDKEVYDNLIFLIPPLTYGEFCDEMGKPNAEYEQSQACGNVVFWSFDRKLYRKTNWWARTASSKVSERITVRTANTVRKLVCL